MGTVVDWGLVVQTAAVVVSAVAVVVALRQGAKDRRNAEKTALEDRRAAQALAVEDRRAIAHRAQLLYELDIASRLSENLLRGGSTDHEESARMGTAAVVLTTLLGPKRMPERFARVGGTEEELIAARENPSMPPWKREALEVAIVVEKIRRELDEDSGATV